jgi:hypothetical protein
MSNEPVRPYLTYLDGELYGDYRTAAERARELPEAVAAGENVTVSNWEPEAAAGPRWTEPRPVAEHDLEQQPEAEAELEA